MFSFYITFISLTPNLASVDKYECWELLIIILSIVLGIGHYL